MGIFLYEEVMPRHLERRPVILSAAKDLCVRGTRSFAALRMTGRIARTSAHGRSSLQMSVFNISFWLSPFTYMGLLNISFSPVHYIFLEITFALFTAILQATSNKCQRDAPGRSTVHCCPD